MDTDVYFHKTVNFRAWKQRLRFRTSQELFSSHDIDTGTRFLLRSIVEADCRPRLILDLGCGYGAIGLTLKKLHPDSVVHMVDRDALAVEYTRQNAELNRLEGIEIYGSLGYDDVKRNDFDLIISNIPGKAGEAVITYLLQEAHNYLAPGGLKAIVAVAALEATVNETLARIPDVETVLWRKRSGHAIFHYRFTGSPASPEPAGNSLERGVYHRQDIDMRLDEIVYKMQTAHGLPEFDSLGYASNMLIKALRKTGVKAGKSAVVFNPGQGHTAVILWQLIKPENIVLVDRDLLALRYCQRNLVLNGCPAGKISLYHQVGLEIESKKKYDLLSGVLREGEGRDAIFLTIKQAVDHLSPDGMIIVTGSSTAITRLVDDVESEGLADIKTRERRRGYSLLILGGK